MTIPHSLISEAAGHFAANQIDECDDHGCRAYVSDKVYVKSFTQGAQWLHSHLMNEAADGFDEYYKRKWCVTDEQLGKSMLYENQKDAWLASQLHSQRRMEELEQKLADAEEALKKSPDIHWASCAIDVGDSDDVCDCWIKDKRAYFTKYTGEQA